MASKTAHSETSEHVRYPRTRQIPANDRWAPPDDRFHPASLNLPPRAGHVTLPALSHTVGKLRRQHRPRTTVRVSAERFCRLDAQQANGIKR